MGAKTKRMYAFAVAQADAVTKALEAGDSQSALAAAAVTPWQPKLTSEQLSKIFSSDQGQEQLAQRMAVITKTPIEQARTQVLQVVTEAPSPIETGTTVNVDGRGVKVANPAARTVVKGESGPVGGESGFGSVLVLGTLLIGGALVVKKVVQAIKRRKTA